MAVFSLANLAYVKREERRRKANFGKKDFLNSSTSLSPAGGNKTTIRAEDLDTPFFWGERILYLEFPTQERNGLRTD